MKPTKMRNQMIYQADYKTKSRQLGSALSKDLRKKYGKRSVRVVPGDSVTVTRGEFKGVDSKVSEVSTQKSTVALDGVKKEATKGEKFDVHIHTSNLMVTSLNGDDRWRIFKLEGKDPKKRGEKSQDSESTDPDTKSTEKNNDTESTEKNNDTENADISDTATLGNNDTRDTKNDTENDTKNDSKNDTKKDDTAEQSQEIKGQETSTDDNQKEGNDK